MGKGLEVETPRRIEKFLKDGFSIEANDIGIFATAFTHSSCGTVNNQRLAFLGDRVFDISVVDRLYNDHPDYGKGALDFERKKIHDEGPQAEVARRIGLFELMAFGGAYGGKDRREMKATDKIMAEVLEAFLCAIYVDQSLEKAKQVVNGLLTNHLLPMLASPDSRNP